jgi:hypothetical protein
MSEIRIARGHLTPFDGHLAAGLRHKVLWRRIEVEPSGEIHDRGNR